LSHCWQAYGADKDRELGLKGEKLCNVVSARRFVGWYNGLPCDAEFAFNLDVEEVAILGHGNVALDVARILLTPIDKLKVRLINAAEVSAH
jgi:adrenodoxin-NADP+ reductase